MQKISEKIGKPVVEQCSLDIWTNQEVFVEK